MNQKPSVMLTDGGLWNTRRPQHSTENTRLLKSNTHGKTIIEFISFLLCIALIDEARINNFQYSQMTNSMIRKRDTESGRKYSNFSITKLSNK